MSTDYLLLDAEPAAQSQPQYQPRQPQSGAGTGDRAERFIRRHGYKAGYVMMAVGAFICLLCIGLRLLWPVIANGFFGGFTADGDSFFSSFNSFDGTVITDGAGNIIDPEDFFGDGFIMDENGSSYDSYEDFFGGNYGGVFDEFEQFDQMANQQMSAAI